MSFSLLSCHPLEFRHVSGVQRRSKQTYMVHYCSLVSSLIVLYKYLNDVMSVYNDIMHQPI